MGLGLGAGMWDSPAGALLTLCWLGEQQADGGLSPGRRSPEQRDMVIPCLSHGLSFYQYPHLGWSLESVIPRRGSTV